MENRAAIAVAVLGAAAVVIGGALYMSGAFPVVGSDEHIDAETRRVDAEAQRDLADALTEVDPCAPTTEQVGAVLNAMGRLQGVGTDTDALDASVKAKMQRPTKSIARAFARGEAVGYTGPIIDGLAKWSGIDTLPDGWMNDPSCEWTAVVRLLAPSAVPSVPGKIEMNARVPLVVSAQGAVTSVPARTEVIGEMQPPPPCTTTIAPTSTQMTITGVLRGESFDLQLSWGSATLDAKTTCVLPVVGPLTTSALTPLGAVTNLPITVAAREGAQGLDTRAGLTVTITRRP